MDEVSHMVAQTSGIEKVFNPQRRARTRITGCGASLGLKLIGALLIFGVSDRSRDLDWQGLAERSVWEIEPSLGTLLVE